MEWNPEHPPILYTIVKTTCLEKNDDIITPVDPGTGGGFTGGGSNPNDPPCTTTQIPTNPQPGFTDENGCPIGAPTQPNLVSTHDPCRNIKKNFANAKFMQKVTAIDKPEVFDYDHEMGFAAAYPPANTGVAEIQYQPMENNIDTHKVRLPDGNQYFAFIHSHNNKEGVAKIFSPADLATFLTSCVSNANESGSIGDAYAMVITSAGNYILKYTGFSTTFGIGPNGLKFWNAWYERAMLEIQNDDKSFDQDKVEKMFLRFLKEKVKINGVQIYKVEKTTGKATELSLDATNTVIPTPCD